MKKHAYFGEALAQMISIMNVPRECGCKGCRTCLLCENKYGINGKEQIIFNQSHAAFVYCCHCNKAWPGWDLNVHEEHPNHKGTPIDFPGIFIDLNFLTDNEESRLVNALDELPWDLSQSGRRKQNFGPKCNFKKRKLRLGDFSGFPKSTQFVQEKFKDVPILKEFQTIEQCSLEYDPKRGASIDPHVDDCWVWGERIVTVNLLSDAVLTMNVNTNIQKYNLDCVETYHRVVEDNTNSVSVYKLNKFLNTNQSPLVRIPMPRKSLLVIYGPARYDWEHRVFREDVKSRRLCLAYREFTPPFLQGHKDSECGKIILDRAKVFF